MIVHKRFALLSALVGVNVLGIFLITRVVHKKEMRLFSFSLNLSSVIFNVSTEDGSTTKILQKYKYHKSSYDIHRAPIFHLTELNAKNYFRHLQNVTCFISGTDWRATRDAALRCECLEGWFGQDCGIPRVVWLSLPEGISPVRRDVPRRVIHGLNVNHELDLFEVRVNELREVVDVYLVCESNYTAYGQNKPLYFLEKFRNGFLSDFQDKIVYVFQDVFPDGGREDGWIADGYQRTFLTQKGIKLISGIRPDDLFVMNDADEVPKREVILFLKLYDGYPEPIRFSLRWTVYGFFWHVPDKHTEVCSVCSINMFHNAMADDGKLLRKQRIHPSLKKSFKSAHRAFNPWVIRGEGGEAGWHCSWCISPEGVRWKLNSAQNGDFPRWGDYPEKKDLTYIKHLIGSGTWFNDVDRFETQESLKFVPEYVLVNREKFQSILINSYTNYTNTTVVTNSVKIN